MVAFMWEPLVAAARKEPEPDVAAAMLDALAEVVAEIPTDWLAAAQVQRVSRHTLCMLAGMGGGKQGGRVFSVRACTVTAACSGRCDSDRCAAKRPHLCYHLRCHCSASHHSTTHPHDLSPHYLLPSRLSQPLGPWEPF